MYCEPASEMSGKAKMEPTRSEDRKSRSNVFVYGIAIDFVLLFGFVAGPFIASKYFRDDGTGSPGMRW